MTEKNNDTNQLPKGWKWVKLGKVCKLKNGFAFKSSEYKNKGIPVIRISDIKLGNVTPDKSVKVSEQKVFDDYIVKSNEILVAMSGATTGKFGIYKSFEKAYQNQRVGKFKILDEGKLDNNFLLYQLHALKRQIEKDAYGGAQPNISSGKIEAMEILLPPKSTQLAIVSKIEELFSELEKGIESLFTAKQQLKTYRQSVLKWAFEGKLTSGLNYDSFDLHDEHDLSIAAEPEVEYKTLKNRGNQKNHLNQSSDNGELPKGWEMVILRDVSKVSGGLTKNSKRQDLKLKLPFLRVANVYFNHLDLAEMHNIGINENEIERVKLEMNDLLFVEGNGSIEQIGRVALWNGAVNNCVHQNHLIKARLSNQVIPKYALYFFCSKLGRDEIKEQANSTSGLHTLSLGKISKLQLPLAPIKEQNNIVQSIESRLSVADKMEESITESLQQAEALKQSILKKAFEGKLI